MDPKRLLFQKWYKSLVLSKVGDVVKDCSVVDCPEDSCGLLCRVAILSTAAVTRAAQSSAVKAVWVANLTRKEKAMTS